MENENNQNQEESKIEEERTTKNMKTPLIFGGVLVAVLGAGGILLLSSQKSAVTTLQKAPAAVSATSTPLATQATPPVEGTSTESANTKVEAVKTISLEAGSFYYKPNEIKVKKGDKIKIVLKAVDLQHDFNIDALDVSIPVTKSGSNSEVTFTAEKEGVFEFYCSVGNHKKMGQVGRLIVE